MVCGSLASRVTGFIWYQIPRNIFSALDIEGINKDFLWDSGRGEHPNIRILLKISCEMPIGCSGKGTSVEDGCPMGMVVPVSTH